MKIWRKIYEVKRNFITISSKFCRALSIFRENSVIIGRKYRKNLKQFGKLMKQFLKYLDMHWKRLLIWHPTG